jgi:hypothetical protein
MGIGKGGASLPFTLVIFYLSHNNEKLQYYLQLASTIKVCRVAGGSSNRFLSEVIFSAAFVLLDC